MHKGYAYAIASLLLSTEVVRQLPILYIIFYDSRKIRILLAFLRSLNDNIHIPML